MAGHSRGGPASYAVNKWVPHNPAGQVSTVGMYMTAVANRCTNCGGRFGLVSYHHWDCASAAKPARKVLSPERPETVRASENGSASLPGQSRRALLARKTLQNINSADIAARTRCMSALCRGVMPTLARELYGCLSEAAEGSYRSPTLKRS
jgi:hypothetical protein